MNWIRPHTRLSIYLRDGLACAWCGQSVEDGAQLTLDHCKPRSKGGSNETTNLVTSCFRCNASRGTRSLKAFSIAVASYVNHGVDAKDIRDHITACRRRSLNTYKSEAKSMMSRRGKTGTKMMSALRSVPC